MIARISNPVSTATNMIDKKNMMLKLIRVDFVLESVAA